MKDSDARWTRNSVLGDLVNKIKLDPLGRQTSNRARSSLVLLKLRLLAQRILRNLDDAIIDLPAPERSIDDPGLLRPPHEERALSGDARGVHLAQLVVDVQRAHPVAHFAVVLVAEGRVG